jgi:hypothetical protein
VGFEAALEAVPTSVATMTYRCSSTGGLRGVPSM